MSSLRSSLQAFIKKDPEYILTATHIHAFDYIKTSIYQDTLLSHYDKNKPMFIASGQGIGAVLLQVNVLEDKLRNNSETEGRFLQFRNRLRPIAFASKSLSEAETRYSNIKREILGVVWAVEHFHHYTFANKINISYHKSLHPLFSGKSLVSCSARTARLLLKIVDKDLRFFYQNGPTMHISDALCRLPTHNTQIGNTQEMKGLKVSISEVSPVQNNVSLDQLKEHATQVLQHLKRYIMEGWREHQNNYIQQLRLYHTFTEELSTVDGLIFKRQRLVVPSTLRYKVLQVLHRSHMGITKTLERSRSIFFWTGIAKDIKQTCGNCEICLKYASRQPKECIGKVQDISEAWKVLQQTCFSSKAKYF